MIYPQPPWRLQGYALQTLQLLDVDLVRPLIPSEFEIISVWPGKTVGGVYLSSYEGGSVLEYHELIIAAGIVRYANKVGGWISHIYVDNANSVTGGREIWQLPKELAEFTWHKGGERGSGSKNYVSVRQGEQTLCQLSYEQPRFGWQLPLSGQVLSTMSPSITLFKGEFNSKVGIVSSQWQVPVESPFASLGLERPWLTFYLDSLHLVAGVPEVVGYREG
ncbi:MAG TPA: acetoacetate decarboxylase [Cyanobacteria bacterium UBA8803]|nr:acetoacetate decarboxylase [Cyanobacteria bacterium UBA9273]HBL58935.1 acetoacetate decarboxylase [Cyanobacteria bacterium UBA8803]